MRSSPSPTTQQMDILFRMVPGPHARVGHITVTGPAGFSVGQIQDIAKMHTGDYVTVQRLSRALDRLRKKYQKQERLLSSVAISKRTYRPETNTVDYEVEIEPGPKVQIAVEGFKISRSQLKKNVPVYEENALDDDLLERRPAQFAELHARPGLLRCQGHAPEENQPRRERCELPTTSSGRPAQAVKLDDRRRKELSAKN